MKSSDIQTIVKKCEENLEGVTNEHELNLVKSNFLGKKSELTQGLAILSKLTGSKRVETGKQLNQLKARLTQLITDKQRVLLEKADFTPVDVTKPGLALKSAKLGHLHPSSLVLKETYQVFGDLGFAIVDSPEIETDWYNFEALNMPKNHPAREMQDTFYLKDSDMQLLPRTHTSGMQVRFMEKNKPPFKIIVPGKVFRSENEDATHSWSFNQIEGLVVGEGVSMADLKGTLLQIVKRQLGPNTEIRFRPSYFPYTEPSVEVDAKFKGKWLELGGAGMVHPYVLENGGIDPEKYSGFAFGWGVERLAVIKYGIEDLRLLWRPNLSYLEQF